MNISVIIPTHNRLEHLKKCLAAIVDSAQENLEIIIVNDASNDGTKDYLDSLKNTKIKIIHHAENKGVSEARNSGIRAATGEIIAFTDDDCVPQPNWLNNLTTHFADEKIGFVFGPTYYITPGYKGYFPERMVSIINWPGGGNIAYRKKIFEKTGGFNQIFEYYHNEDTEMAVRAVAIGYKYQYEPAAICHHQKKPDWQTSSLLDSAKNSSVWPLLKKTYPKYYLTFNPRPAIRLGIFISPQDYFYLLVMPIILPLLMARYLWHGKKDLKIFFAKWPVYFILKRFYIYKEAIKNKTFMI